MPRYFFNTKNGHVFSDNEGTELADLPAARLAAVQLTGQILKDESEGFLAASEWQLNVADEGGSVLFSLNVSTIEEAEDRSEAR